MERARAVKAASALDDSRASRQSSRECVQRADCMFVKYSCGHRGPRACAFERH